MKKTILLTLTLIISYASIGQRKVTLLNSDTALLETHYIEPYSDRYKKLLVNGFVDKGDKLQFYDHKNTREILRLNSKGDTLEIKSQSIKYIKIDGKVYEIKRYTELKEVSDNYGIFLSPRTWVNFMPTINVDTSYYKPIKIQKQHDNKSKRPN